MKDRLVEIIIGFMGYCSVRYSTDKELAMSEEDIKQYNLTADTIIKFIEEENCKPPWICIDEDGKMYNIEEQHLEHLGYVKMDDMKLCSCDRGQVAGNLTMDNCPKCKGKGIVAKGGE